MMSRGMLAHPPVPALHKGGKDLVARWRIAASELSALGVLAPPRHRLAGLVSELSQRRRSTRSLILNDGRLGNGRSWISRVPGKGIDHDYVAGARGDRPRRLGPRS